MIRSLSLCAASVLIFAACGGSGSDGTTGGGGSTGGTGGANASSGSTVGSSGTGTSAGTSTGGSSSSGNSTGGSGAGGGNPGVPDAATLLGLLGTCNTVSNGGYKTDNDPGLPSNISICGLNGAVYWQADMDVDCDGKQSAQCNLQTDPAYQAQTSATASNGEFLDAAALPFVVVPLPSSRFDYNAAGLELGSVIAVIYNNQVAFGPFGDEGPSNIIGEASYAMANSLGIDPDPSTGGIDSGVTYIAFTGASGVLSKIEDHAEAVQLGQTLATQLIQNN